MSELFSFKRKVDLTDYTLIIPSVSVGNVPQLTVDLLITSLDFKKSATIWHPAIVSAVGHDPYEINGSEVCTACELYINEELKIALVQLRSTLESKLVTRFFGDLKTSLLECKIKNVVILTSSFDYELHEVDKSKFYYISNQDVDSIMKDFNIKPKEKGFDGNYAVHGSGFTVKLFEVLKGDFECTVLIKYVSEGDNRPDAVATLHILSKLVNGLQGFNLKSVKFPSSWSCVFGGPPPIGMF